MRHTFLRRSRLKYVHYAFLDQIDGVNTVTSTISRPAGTLVTLAPVDPSNA
jgi:hypothetical protein